MKPGLAPSSSVLCVEADLKQASPADKGGETAFALLRNEAGDNFLPTKLRSLHMYWMLCLKLTMGILLVSPVTGSAQTGSPDQLNHLEFHHVSNTVPLLDPALVKAT